MLVPINKTKSLMLLKLKWYYLKNVFKYLVYKIAIIIILYFISLTTR